MSTYVFTREAGGPKMVKDGITHSKIGEPVSIIHDANNDEVVLKWGGDRFKIAIDDDITIEADTEFATSAEIGDALRDEIFFLEEEDDFRATGSTLNRLYTSDITGGGTSLTPTVNTLYAIPFKVKKRITIDQMTIECITGGAGSSARVGIYEDDGNLYPSALVVDAGAQTTQGTAVRNYTGLNVTLRSNRLYWLVYVNNGTSPSIRAIQNMLPIFGFGAAVGGGVGIGYSVAFTYAALPASFPAGASIISGAALPLVLVRLSS